MADIAAFPTITEVLYGEGNVQSFTAGETIKTGQVVGIDATSWTVVVMDATAFERVIGVAINGASSGEPVGVAMNGSIAKVANADGSSKTLMIGELNYGLKDYLWSVCKPSGTVKWGEARWAVGYPGITWGSAVGPLNSDGMGEQIYGLFNAGYESFRSDHAGGVNFTFVDGSVRFISAEIPVETLKKLATREGGETVDTSDL